MFVTEQSTSPGRQPLVLSQENPARHAHAPLTTVALPRQQLRPSGSNRLGAQHRHTLLLRYALSPHPASPSRQKCSGVGGIVATGVSFEVEIALPSPAAHASNHTPWPVDAAFTTGPSVPAALRGILLDLTFLG
jgi:hypothetical protein